MPPTWLDDREYSLLRQLPANLPPDGGKLIQRFMNAGLGDFIQQAKPAAIAISYGKCPPGKTGARRRQRIHYIATTANAPTGIPPPMILPRQVRSGTTP